MLQKLNEKASLMAIKLHLKKEEVKNGLLNGNKDELHEMMGIGTTIAIAAGVFIIMFALMKVFAPEVMDMVTDYFKKILGDAFGGSFTPDGGWVDPIPTP